MIKTHMALLHQNVHSSHWALNYFEFMYKLCGDLICNVSLEDADCVLVGVPSGYIDKTLIFDEPLASKICRLHKPVFLFDVQETHRLCDSWYPELSSFQIYKHYFLDTEFEGNLKAVFKVNYSFDQYRPTESGLSADIYSLELFTENAQQRIDAINREFPIVDKLSFSNRPFDILFFGNLSNVPGRLNVVRLIEQIYPPDKILRSVSEVYQIRDKFLSGTSISGYAIIFDRLKNRQAQLKITPMLELNYLSKLGVSVEGHGMKCFRHLEVPRTSLMIKDGNHLHWSFPWIDQHNCIELPYEYQDQDNVLNLEKGIDKLKSILNNPELMYNCYVNCVQNWKNYQIPTYYTKYLIPTITKYL